MLVYVSMYLSLILTSFSPIISVKNGCKYKLIKGFLLHGLYIYTYYIIYCFLVFYAINICLYKYIFIAFQ